MTQTHDLVEMSATGLQPVEASNRTHAVSLAWVATTLAMAAGAGLTAWTAAIHLDLWQTGYRQIPTIGTLFLLQAIAGFALAGAVLLSRRLLPALAAAGFNAATIGGLLISVNFGLFGFKDSLNAPFGVLSLVIEGVAFGVLGTAALLRVVLVRRARTRASVEEEVIA